MAALLRKVRKTVVLLGAGASKPGGVPTATEMTAQMLKRCTQTEFRRPLRAIVGALQMQQAHSLRQVDVEQVMNAAVLLADRLTLEFAPFVAAWHPIIDELERKRFDRLAANQLTRRAMGWKPLGSRSIPPSKSPERDERVVTEGKLARAIEAAFLAFGRQLDQRPNGDVFSKLSAHLTRLLIDIVWQTDSEKFKYLDPLINLGRHHATTIATLNYDNGVELRARSEGVTCSTGITEWVSTGQLPNVTRGIQLLKLHGSANWMWNAAPRYDHSLSIERKITEIAAPDLEGEDEIDTALARRDLAVLFGGRNKLTAEGPFLDLLMSFRDHLFQNNCLVVIGYSFRDPHVNHYILRWLNSSRHRRMYIVDVRGTKIDDHPFFESHYNEFGERVKLIAKGAKTAISELFG